MNSKDTHEKLKEKIRDGNYTLFDKIIYGGFGYGYFCVPSDVFKWIFTGIFPPLGILIHYFGKLSKSFPYITSQNIKNIISHFDEFIIAFLGTMLFYIPGLLYVINIFNKSLSSDEDLKEDYDDTKNMNKTNNNEDDNNKDDNDDKNNENDDDNDNNSEDSDNDSDYDEFEPTNLDNLRKTLFDD